MPGATRSIERGKLRRIALANQGLIQREPFGRGRAATLRAIGHLGYVQIDTISVVVRAHDHVLRTRVENFEPQHIDRLLQDRQIFEYLFPVAAFRPIEDYRFVLPLMRSARSKRRSRDDKRMMKRVLERVAAEGPLKSRDFEDPRSSRKGWWDWKPAKRALEQLYYQGDLMISARDGFQKSYDLAERVLPSSIDLSEPTVAEFAGHLVDNTLRAHGFASYKSFVYGARGGRLGGALKAEIRRRAASGELLEVSDRSGRSWWCEPETLDARAPRARKRAHILSPFDNTIIQRERAQRVFDFDYRIECYLDRCARDSVLKTCSRERALEVHM